MLFVVRVALLLTSHFFFKTKYCVEGGNSYSSEAVLMPFEDGDKLKLSIRSCMTLCTKTLVACCPVTINFE